MTVHNNDLVKTFSQKKYRFIFVQPKITSTLINIESYASLNLAQDVLKKHEIS